MKKAILFFLIGFSFYSLAAQAPVEEASKTEKKQVKTKSRKENRTKNRQTSNGLSDAQGQQVKEINKDYHEKMKSIKNEAGLSEQQKKEKAALLNTERQNKIKELVGVDKYDAMKEEKHDLVKDEINKDDKTKDLDKEKEKDKEKGNRGKGKKNKEKKHHHD
jgi:hypothetical protein